MKTTQKLDHLIKLFIDARDITGGNVDVKSFEYDTDGPIDELINFIERNGLNIDNVVTDLELFLNEQLNSVNNNLNIINNDISITRTNLSTTNNKVDGLNVPLNNIDVSLKVLIDDLVKKIRPNIVKEKEYIKQYIEIRTTKYIYTNRSEKKDKVKVETINWGTTKPINGDWQPLVDIWLYKEANNTYYFKTKNASDSKELRLYEFLSKQKNRPIIDLLFERGIIDKPIWQTHKYN